MGILHHPRRRKSWIFESWSTNLRLISEIYQPTFWSSVGQCLLCCVEPRLDSDHSLRIITLNSGHSGSLYETYRCVYTCNSLFLYHTFDLLHQDSSLTIGPVVVKPWHLMDKSNNLIIKKWNLKDNLIFISIIEIPINHETLTCEIVLGLS